MHKAEPVGVCALGKCVGDKHQYVLAFVFNHQAAIPIHICSGIHNREVCLLSRLIKLHPVGRADLSPDSTLLAGRVRLIIPAELSRWLSGNELRKRSPLRIARVLEAKPVWIGPVGSCVRDENQYVLSIAFDYLAAIPLQVCIGLHHVEMSMLPRFIKLHPIAVPNLRPDSALLPYRIVLVIPCELSR